MKKLILSVIIFLSVPVLLYSQGIKFGVGGGLSMVQSPDYLTKSAEDGGYGFDAEYHFGLKAILELPLTPIVPVGFVNYHLLSGDSAISQNVLTVGVGVHYNLIPGPLSPYAALNLQFNSFGDADVDTLTVSGFTRTGIGVGAGVDFSLIPSLNLDVSANYNILNLMGKEENEETISIITLNVTLMFGGI